MKHNLRSQIKIIMLLKKGYLKDPFVHDNNSNIETPPLKNSKNGSNNTPLAQYILLHFSLTIGTPVGPNWAKFEVG